MHSKIIYLKIIDRKTLSSERFKNADEIFDFNTNVWNSISSHGLFGANTRTKLFQTIPTELWKGVENLTQRSNLKPNKNELLDDEKSIESKDRDNSSLIQPKQPKIVILK